MPTEDVIPTREELLPAFFNNLAAKLGAYQVLLGLTVAQVAQVVTDAAFVEAIFLLLEEQETNLREGRQYKNLELYGPRGEPMPGPPAAGPPIAISSVPVDIIGRTRELIQQIKRAPAYTAVIGQDLGIIASNPTPPADEKPKLKAKAIGNYHVEVAFNKAGHAGVDFECKRGNEVAYVTLAFDTFSPLVDNRPPLVANQPEVRTYRGKFRDREGPVGGWSDEVSVTVGP